MSDTGTIEPLVKWKIQTGVCFDVVFVWFGFFFLELEAV